MFLDSCYWCRLGYTGCMQHRTMSCLFCSVVSTHFFILVLDGSDSLNSENHGGRYATHNNITPALKRCDLHAEYQRLQTHTQNM